MNSTSVQIALRPALNDDVAGIIANYYYQDMRRKRRILMNTLHLELMEELQKRLKSRMSVIDEMLEDPNLAKYGSISAIIKMLLDDQDYFQNQMLEIEMEIFNKYIK